MFAEEFESADTVGDIGSVEQRNNWDLFMKAEGHLATDLIVNV